MNLDGAAEIKRVLITGASRIGIQLARLLEQTRRDVVLLEADSEMATWAGEQLEKTLVVRGDSKERTILVQENVDTFDAFVATSKSEEHNVLSALMAKDLGVRMAVAVVHQPELKPFLEGRGIDLAVAPRLNAVGAILRHVDPVTKDMELRSVGHERLITFRVTKDSDIAGRTIRRIHFPANTIVPAILRGDDVILPRGDDTVEVGDMVLAFSVSGSVQALERLFR
jgi:trk system potassium uptake protein TrkA